MPITLTLNAENAQELVNMIRNLAMPAGTEIRVHQVTTPAADHIAPTTAEKLDKALDKAIDEVERTEAAVARPKRGRPAKAAADTLPIAEPVPAPAPAPAPVTAPQVEEALFGEAKQALADYVANHKENGREKAIEILRGLGVARLTELDTSGLQRFLTAIKANA